MRERYLLLVEDDTDHVALIVRALGRAGFSEKTVWMADGDEALAYLFRQANSGTRPAALPSLVILDLKLPGISGLDVLAAIRQHEATRPLPVVALSSSDEKKDVTEAYRLGVNSYVVKPVNYLEFEMVIKRLTRFWLDLNQGT